MRPGKIYLSSVTRRVARISAKVQATIIFTAARVPCVPTHYVRVHLFCPDPFPAEYEFHKPDIDRGLPLADAFVHLVAAAETIEDLENPRVYITELFGVAKPGGWGCNQHAQPAQPFGAGLTDVSVEYTHHGTVQRTAGSTSWISDAALAQRLSVNLPVAVSKPS